MSDSLKSCFSDFDSRFSGKGFTLLEVMIVGAIIGTLTAIAIPNYIAYRTRAMEAHAVSELKTLTDVIAVFEIDNNRLPATLNELKDGAPLDPWGTPYQYQNFQIVPQGKWRKDKFLVPINTSYDLWSMGPDGASQPPLTAKASQDDIIRANDGAFIGKASAY